jgi:S-adenosylmethionine synthetase
MLYSFGAGLSVAPASPSQPTSSPWSVLIGHALNGAIGFIPAHDAGLTGRKVMINA